MDSGGKSHFCVRWVGGKADLVIFLNDFLLIVLMFQLNEFGNQRSIE